jgi:tellurite resistance protein
MNQPTTPLKYLYPGWYAVVMGLAGLALAWNRAAPLMGDVAAAASQALGGLAALVFVVLLAATVQRWRQHPEAWAEDQRHPVRHTFIAALPVAMILLATVAVATLGPSPLASALWWVGCVAQLGITVWVLRRWWAGNGTGGLQWTGVTPALLIPIVGNVLVPLAGVPLGQMEWAAAQFGIGLMFWPLVMALLVVRIAVHGIWPERLRPTAFIVIAPPSVVGLAVLQLGALPLLGWMCWGMALACLLWAGALAKQIAGMPFGLTHWAVSFPLAAFTALTLRLATPSGPLSILGPALLALSTLVIGALLFGTWRGLRDGTLLAPEPVAAIVAAKA